MGEFLFQEVFRTSIVPTLVIKKSGTVLLANDAFLTLHHLVEEEVVGSECQSLYSILGISESEMRGIIEVDKKFTLLKTNIHKRTYHIHANKINCTGWDEPLLVLQWQEFSHNIEKQEETIRYMKQYKHFIKQSQDALIVTVNGIIQYLNPAGVRLLGGDRKEEYIGNSFFDFIHGDYLGYVKERMKNLLLDLPIEALAEVKLVTNRGIVAIESSATKVEFMGQDAIQYFIRDVTDRNNYDEMAKRSEKLTMVSKLAAGVAHEIRNPMTAIKGFIQLLKASKQYNEEYSDIMLEELDRIESIIQEFLTLAKPKRENAYKEKSIQEILRHVTLLLATHANYKNCQITSKFIQEPLAINCEENALKQVFINLIQNGLESMTQGTVTVSLQKRDNYAVVTIEDQGCGIDEESLAHLGEPFFSTKPSGTGLGLMISYRIIEQHNGQISFASEIGVGTKVEILLPLIHTKLHSQIQ